MKTKIIPFNLETAKKIQKGEIKGKIKTNQGKEARIICTDKASTDEDNRTQIVCLIRQEAIELVSIHDQNTGKCFDIEYGKAQHLVLEVSDIQPQFKVGDKVRVKPNDTHSHFVKQYDNCIGKIVGEHHEYFVVIVTGAFQDQFTADELELVEETGKHEFKPFDKVLVRKDENADGEPDTWVISFFMDESIAGYRVLNGEWFDQCIPYEGNEYLAGTTDKPKENEI